MFQLARMNSGRNSAHWRPLTIAGLIGLALLAVLALGGPARALAAPCPHANDAIDEATAKQHAAAIVCLIGKDRAQRDLHALDRSSKLDAAAGRHNRTMLKKDCWEHDCPGEPGLGGRIRDTGYLNGVRSWTYAENFGCAATPRGMLEGWLSKAFSRWNIREKVFRDVGTAAARDQVGASQCDDGNEITFTVVFAQRRG